VRTDCAAEKGASDDRVVVHTGAVMTRKHLAPLSALLGAGLLGAPTPVDAAPHGSKSASTKTGPGVIEMLDAPGADTFDVLTRHGTKVSAQVYAGGQWRTPRSGFRPASKLADRRNPSAVRQATGEVVLIVAGPDDTDALAPVVSLFHSMGATVVTFDSPFSGDDNPRAPSKKTPASKGRFGPEEPADIVHAMVTWASKQSGAKGDPARVNVFGFGGGADLALLVGSQRTEDLWSIMVDGASTKAIDTAVPKLSAATADFQGLLVLGGDKTTAATLKPMGSRAAVNVGAKSSLVGSKALDVVRDSAYQEPLVTFLNSDVLAADDCGSIGCGLTRTEKRTVLRLYA